MHVGVCAGWVGLGDGAYESGGWRAIPLGASIDLLVTGVAGWMLRSPEPVKRREIAVGHSL